MKYIKTYEVKRKNQLFKKFKEGDWVRLTSKEYIPNYWSQHNINLDILQIITVDPTDTLAYEVRVLNQNVVEPYWFEECELEKLSDVEIAAIKYNL